MLEYFGYACAFLAIGSSIIGFTYIWALRAYIKKWSRKKPERYPAVTIISPQRGEVDERNIDAILRQNYPGKMEVIFVTTQDDASFPQLQKYSTENKNIKTVIADDAVLLAQKKGIHRCQKNNNLITAIAACSPETEVYVIVDADARPFNDWLSNLVAPFANGNPNLGAVTSARVYLPGKGLASWVQVLWILISDSFLVGEHRYIWGGGLAIPKAVFEKENLLFHINGEGGCSITTDDMNIYVALRKKGYETIFSPDCIVLRHPPEAKENLLDVITFTNRQILQTWWTNKSIWTFLVIIGIRFPMLLCALVVAWWYPWCLIVLLSVVIDTSMGITTLKILIDAEPRVSAKVLFWPLNSSGDHSGRLLEPKIRVNVNFWVVLLPFVTPFVVTINSIFVPFFKRMRWSGIEYTRRKVVGYTDDFSWRAK